MVQRYILYYLLHREQLHVSALDNGHLQPKHVVVLYVINNIILYIYLQHIVVLDSKIYSIIVYYKTQRG